MKAVRVKSSKVDGIVLEETEKPNPGSRDVLIRVHCSSVCQGDVKLRQIPNAILVPVGFLFGFKPMTTPGVEFAGVVESVGAKVTKFKPGDQVFGTATSLAHGGNAEYIRVPETRKVGVLIHKPESVPFSDAAVFPVGVMTAYQMLKRVGIEENRTILIYGASGSVGTYAIQLARHFSFRITGVTSTRNRDLVESLGAQTVLDYTDRDSFPPPDRFDAVLDCVGKLNVREIKRMLKESGTFRTVKSPTKEVESELTFLTGLLEQKILSPVVDRSYPLSQVRDAHEYVEQGHKVGNVLIEVK